MKGRNEEPIEGEESRHRRQNGGAAPEQARGSQDGSEIEDRDVRGVGALLDCRDQATDQGNPDERGPVAEETFSDCRLNLAQALH